MLAFELAGGRGGRRGVHRHARRSRSGRRRSAASSRSSATRRRRPTASSTTPALAEAGITPGPAALLGRARGPRRPRRRLRPGARRRARAAAGRAGDARPTGRRRARPAATPSDPEDRRDRQPRDGVGRIGPAARARRLRAARAGRCWRLFTSVDFAVVQIIAVAARGRRDDDPPAAGLRLPLGRRLRDRDGRAPLDLRPGPRASGIVDAMERLQLFHVFTSTLVQRRAARPRRLDRRSAPSTGRRGCGGSRPRSGSSSPTRSSTRGCPTGRDGRRRPDRRRRRRGAPAPAVRRPRGGRTTGRRTSTATAIAGRSWRR